MSLAPELLSLVGRALAAGNARRPDVTQHLRAAFPGVSFTLCDDNDVPSRMAPLAEGEGFALYGIHTGAHCASLTTCLDSASGLAVALRDDDV